MPIWRFTRLTTWSGSILAIALACVPTTTFVGLSRYTTDGVVSSPSPLRATAARPVSSTKPTAEYVVPRSIP